MVSSVYRETQVAAPSVQGFLGRGNNFSVGLRRGYHHFRGPQVIIVEGVQRASGKGVTK
jgi:hypothetical protein